MGTIARRTFLLGSATVVGGFAVGYYFYRRTPENPLLGSLPAGAAALTPYLRIDASGITIITPRAEMGQGVHTSLAALVAEELDIAWTDVRVDHGPPSPTYYNGAVAAEGFPFAATDQGRVARLARGFGDVVGKFAGLQITGGSSTVPDGFEKMRLAGAAARQMLISAAAELHDVPVAELRSADGAVVLPDATRLPYATLAEHAARLEVPAAPALKPRSEWRYLGKSMPRVDMVAKCTGTATYGIDVSPPGLLYATVRTNPRLGGGVESFDATAAEQARGVIKVVPVSGGVAVVADNTWRAFRAAGLISFKWGAAPYPATTAEMFDAVAASFTAERQDSRLKDEGDAELALRDAAVVEAEYRVPFLAHAPLEPMNAVVQLAGGNMQIWTGTQVPLQAIKAAAAIAGIEADDVRLHVQLIGGSFGRRLEDDYVRQAVEVAQAMEGRPVKMTWTREEDMTHDFCRPLGIARMRGAVRDGKVDALDASIAYPSVTASQTGRIGLSVPGADVAIVAGAWDQPFAIPHYRVTGYRVPELAPVSSWRSVGASGNGFFHDCFLDELIHAAGADAMAERIRLASHAPSRQVLEAVAEMSGWGGPLEANRGRGVAFTLAFGVPCAQVVEVTVTPEGIRIDKVFAAVDVGTVIDPQNLEAQVSGGIVWGLGHAIYGEITYTDGAPEQTNYHDYRSLRMYQTPAIEVRALENLERIRGIGEPGVPPAAPALANAIFAATGKRIRELPLGRHIGFI
jgi:isoquinoline 1-oxidoreductase beta subunit